MERVSVLFNEPKLLKCYGSIHRYRNIEEGFSALQRAEIAEMELIRQYPALRESFSALQRAEIAEISRRRRLTPAIERFSALQRAEIAEIPVDVWRSTMRHQFQCSSTSRNC